MAAVAGNLIKSVGNFTSSLLHAPSSLKGLSQCFVLKSQLNATQSWTPLVTSVRHRYFAERREKGPLLRNYGYDEKLHNKGKVK